MNVHSRARRLRRDSTEAEKVLWRGLRARMLSGAKFRRQQPIGPYVVDFISFEHRVIVEVDGGQHASEDPTRQRYLEAKGYHVLRFWNHEVLQNVDGVLNAIGGAITRG